MVPGRSAQRSPECACGTGASRPSCGSSPGEERPCPCSRGFGSWCSSLQVSTTPSCLYCSFTECAGHEASAGVAVETISPAPALRSLPWPSDHRVPPTGLLIAHQWWRCCALLRSPPHRSLLEGVGLSAPRPVPQAHVLRTKPPRGSGASEPSLLQLLGTRNRVKWQWLVQGFGITCQIQIALVSRADQRNSALSCHFL